MLDDPTGAFVPGEPTTVAGAAGGPLSGLTFAAPDVFDVVGHVTGAGNPDWRRTHRPARATAPVIERLVDAGADLVGRTISDELAFGLLGINAHDGTPTNPLAPDSVPGGPSSGSASATAAGVVDFALAAGSGASVLVPAGLCGTYGVRPTPDVVPLDAMVGLARSFDTVGWFAREWIVLWQVAATLLGSDPGDRAPHDRIIIADDVWDLADDPVVDALLPVVQRLAVQLEPVHVEVLAEGGLDRWAQHIAALHGREAWERHREWLETTNPTLALDVKQRFDQAAALTDDQVIGAGAARDQIARQLGDLLGSTTVLALPTTPEIAPLLDSSEHELSEFRRRAETLSSIADLGGLPQVTVPAARLAEYPVGLSLIGGRGTDHQLLALAATVTRRSD